MASVRVWVKNKVELDRLNIRQKEMFKLGNVAVASVKERVRAARGPDDGAAKPLTKRYAIRKTKLGLGNRRNLSFTGEMLAKFQVRTVTEDTARAYVTAGGGTAFPMAETLKNRRRRAKRAGKKPPADAKLKAWINQQRQPWMTLSPKNQAAVLKAGQILLNNAIRTLAKGSTR